MALDADICRTRPQAIKVVVLEGANSRVYLSAVFSAYREGDVVLALSRTASDPIPGMEIACSRHFTEDPGWFDEPFAPIRTDTWAQVSFSSGTTGKPKAILLSHRALSDVVERINAAMEVDETIREYVGVPVTFSFGFGRVRAVAAAGGRSYLPAKGFDPSEIARMLQAGEINAISAVPTLWRVVIENPQVIGAAGERARWIEIGSQYMSAEEKAAMKRLFPNARIVQHYGLTEASRTTLLDITAAEGAALESVGRAIGKVEIAIAPDGAIRVRGPHVAEGVVTEDGVIPIVDADGWLTTADRGRIEDGLLYYEGRTDELINVGGIKIHPTRFEQRLGERLRQADAVAVGKLPDPLRGERVLVALHQGSGLARADVACAAQQVASEYGLVGRGALTVRTVAEIPRTATGKVRRRDLPDLPDLDREEPATPTAGAPPAEVPTARAAELQAIWASALGVLSVSLHESFYDLGGDSLSALTVILRMEAQGIDPDIARGLLDGKSIAELTGLARPQPVPEVAAAEASGSISSHGTALTLSEAMGAIHGVRGVLALWVVVVHWLPGILMRLPGQPIGSYVAIEPLLRFGTPGFAIVFGLGIGALGIPQYLRSPTQFRTSTWLKFRLVAGGVLLMALFAFGVMWSQGRLDNPNWPSKLFYSAISYYALALLALPWILRLLTAWPHVLLTILTAMVGSMAFHEVLHSLIAWQRPDGFVELAKILVTAKYGFFRMTGYVLLGVAIGYLFRQNHDMIGFPRIMAVSGAAFLGAGVLIGHKAHPGAVFEDVGNVMPWHLLIYAGMATLILALFCRFNQGGGAGLPRLIGWLTAFFTATGIMALPIFVGHEIVIPAKTFLYNLGMIEGVSLAFPLAVFLGGLAWGYMRLIPLVSIGIVSSVHRSPRAMFLRRGLDQRNRPAPPVLP